MRTVRSLSRSLLLSLALAWAIPSAARADAPAYPAPAPAAPDTPVPGGTPNPEAPAPEAPAPEEPAPQPRPPPAPRPDLPPPQSRYIPGGAHNSSIGGAPVYDVGSKTLAPASNSGNRAVAGTGIVAVTPREVVAPGGGGTEFKVRFRVEGDGGRSFYLNAVFLDPATGQAVKARRPAYADRTTGALYVLLTPVSHAGGTTEYQALIQLPSDAMDPVAAGSDRRLDARVQLFRRSRSGGLDESMDWLTVPFVVRGSAGAGSARTATAAPVSSNFASATPGAFPAPSPAGTGTTSPGPAPVAPSATAPGATRIVNVTKHHNEPASDGRLHLRLETPYEVMGDQGRSFYLRALFFDRATGQPIASTRPEFADQATGALYVITQPGKNESGGRYNAGLRVPYDAFPKPAPGTTLGVEARVTLLRRAQGAGQDEELDTAAVTFQVHGD